MKSSQFISIDQSISKCAWMYWIDGVPVDKGVILTGDSSAKTLKKDVEYFATTDDRMARVGELIIKAVHENWKVGPLGFERPFNEVPVIFEGLSFGSAGNATRDLAGLYYVMRYMLNCNGICNYDDMYTYVPTSIKSLARSSLGEDKQTTISPKTGKPVKVKMDKKLMVEACENEMGVDFLKGYNYSNGKDDLADAFWLGKLFMSKEN